MPLEGQWIYARRAPTAPSSRRTSQAAPLPVGSSTEPPIEPPTETLHEPGVATFGVPVPSPSAISAPRPIDPDECINCGFCEPECPWEAIFEDEQVREVFAATVELNAKVTDHRDQLEVPEREEVDSPSPEDVKENEEKWGYEG